MSSFSLPEDGEDPFSFSSLLLHKAKEAHETFQKIFKLEEEIFWVRTLASFSKEEALSYKIRRRSLLLADFLIDEKGEIDKEKLSSLLQLFEKEGFHIPYLHENESFFIEQKMLLLLKELLNSPRLYQQFRKFDLPLCNPFVKSLVEMSLLSSKKLGKREVRVAVLAAGLGFLRQNVGSCFATAPAILIHLQNLEDFYSDLFSLLTLGKLKRIFSGVEYSVPLAPSIGSALLKKRVSSSQMLQTPALLHLLTEAGLIDPKLSFQEKQSACANLIEAKGFDYTHLSYETVLDALLFSVKEELKEKLFSLFQAYFEDPLLKLWEFTLASFSEVKMEFSNWNLYTSLGLNADDQGGIGPLIYRFFKQHLDITNAKIEELHKEYLIAFEQVRATEGLIANAYSEEQIRRLKSELTARYYHMRTSLEMRQDAEHKAKLFADLYPYIISSYKEKFPEFFQEIYDPDLSEIKTGIWDDAPAGFRLVFKHGRTEASLWSKIESEKDYLEALITFFKQSEYSIAKGYDQEDILDIIHRLTTEILLHLQQKEFLQSAFFRVKKSSRDAHYPHFDKTPWAYISGGTLSTLIKTYYRREGEITMENRCVESPTDLLIFIIDTLKALPTRITSALFKNREKRLLAHSPSHAFLLIPGREPFFNSWQSNAFTYTWVRDQWITPAKEFWQKLSLSQEALEFFLFAFTKSLKGTLSLSSHPFPRFGSLGLKEIAEYLAALVQHPSQRQGLLDHFHSFCHHHFPIVEKAHVLPAVLSLLPPSLQQPARPFLESLPLPQRHYFASDVREIAKLALLHLQKSCFFSFDVHAEVYRAAQKEGLAPPTALVFADTNWSYFSFAFILSPTTLELELWRTDRIGEVGAPMSIWNAYLYGQTQEVWSIYTDPFQWGG